MTIGRTDDPENPAPRNGFRSRVIVWGWIAEPIWASGHASAPTGRTHDRNRPPVIRIFLLHPRGRPHMRGAQRRPGLSAVSNLSDSAHGLRACCVPARLAMTAWSLPPDPRDPNHLMTELLTIDGLRTTFPTQSGEIAA